MNKIRKHFYVHALAECMADKVRKVLMECRFTTNKLHHARSPLGELVNGAFPIFGGHTAVGAVWATFSVAVSAGFLAVASYL